MPHRLAKIDLFHGFTPQELDAISPCIVEKSYNKGEVLFSEGSPCERVFFVESGRVKIYRIASSGREQTLETIGPGDTCACNPGAAEWSCSSTAEAVTPCKVWHLSREHYVRLVRENSKLAHALNEVFARRIQALSSLVEEVSLKDVNKRLVKFLLDMLDEKASKGTKRGKSEVLFIPFTREEIAQRLGTARETVARYLTRLKKSRLIDLKPYQIVILNPDGLRKLL